MREQGIFQNAAQPNEKRHGWRPRCDFSLDLVNVRTAVGRMAVQDEQAATNQDI